MRHIKRFDMRAQVRLAWGLLAVIMLIYALAMSHQALLRYDTFKASAFDLGNMDQVLWNTIHGRLFQFTNQAIDWYGPPTRLAIHFEPIMLLVSLLYAIRADVHVLLVFQTFALVSGALPVFLLTRRYIPGWPLLAPVMALAYLLSPALLGVNIFDFHPDSLATPLLLYSFLLLSARRYRWFLVICVFIASCKEDIPLVLAVFGILLIWKYKLPRLGTTLLLGGLLWSFIAFKFIIPHFYPGTQANNFWYRYEALGSSPGAALVNLLTRPWIIFSTLVTFERLYYLASLLRSTGFLALLAPEWLLPALPILAVNILSTENPLLYSGVYHYNAAIIPFIVLAAIHGARRLILIWQGWEDPARRAEEERALLVGSPPPYTPVTPARPAADSTLTASSLPSGWKLLFVTTFTYARTWLTRVGLFFQPLRQRLYRWSLSAWRAAQLARFGKRMEPLARQISAWRLQWLALLWITLMTGLNFWIAAPQLNPFWADHEPGPREQHIEQLLALIPPTASVSAGANLNPHLSERQLLAVFPSVCLDVACDQTVQYVIVDLNSLTIENRAAASSALNALSQQFRIIARADGVVLMERRSP